MEKKKLSPELRSAHQENDLKALKHPECPNDLFAETLQEMLEAELIPPGYEKNVFKTKGQATGVRA